MNWNWKLDECKSKLKILYEFKWNLGIFLDFVFLFFPVLITISMNLFDQQVIVICDPDLRDLAPSGKNLSLVLLFVVS